jgi:hypothetical protein
MRTTKRYLRGLKKNKKTRKNRSRIRKVGGHINSSKIFENILSIGFEMEATDLIKFTLTKDEMTGNYILVNSSLANVDLEYGFTDPDEYTYTKETPDETFKITNDANEDSEFNELVEKLYYSNNEGENEGENEEVYQEGGEEEFEEYEEYEEEDNEDEGQNIILKIPPNQYLPQSDYTVKFREPSSELLNFSSFTATEFIATYYNPVKSKDIILKYLFKSVRELSDHLSKLVTINNSKMIINKNDEVIEIPNLFNQSYVLPNTSLVYFNGSFNNIKRLQDIKRYNIIENLDLVIQMTFSCNIMYCYRIMTQLLSIEEVDIIKYETHLNKYLNIHKNRVEPLLKILNRIKNNDDYDNNAIKRSMNITNELFTNYNNMYKTYPLDKDDDNTRKIKSYLFLIIYKLFIYLNSYIEDKDKSGTMLKKMLSFAVRHYNYALFLQLKNLINNYFVNKDNGINASIIIQQLLDDKILNNMYLSPTIRNQKTKLNIEVKNDPNLQSKYYGDPLFSIKSYFDYFDKFNADWLEANSIDEKSTKFDLKNDVVIIEFRDFPLYTYLELFSMADDNVKNEILKNHLRVLNMRVLNHFISK